MSSKFIYDKQAITIEKTANYFDEAVRCYEAGCYRATMGVLYCVCMCDIIYKLEEARDVYNFQNAEHILEEMIKHQQNNKENWERSLLESVKKETNLLDDASYKTISEIRNWRHLSVHPAMDEDNNLVKVSPEEAYAKLQAAYSGLLTKPVYHIKSKDIVKLITEDLLLRRIELKEDTDLIAYVNKAYHIDTIQDSIFLKVLRAFWKLIFRTQNADTEKGREINKRFLSYLCTQRKEIVITYLLDTPKYFDINRELWETANAFLCYHKNIYNVLPGQTKLMLQNMIRTSNCTIDILGGWYINNSLEEHLQDMSTALSVKVLRSSGSEIKVFRNKYHELDLGCLDKFLIEKVKEVGSFSEAGDYYNYCLKPYIKEWSKDLCDLFYAYASKNDQVYNYCRYQEMCQMVAKRATEFQTREELIEEHPFLDSMLPTEY